MKVVQIDVGRENIVARQKVVYLRKIYWRTKLRAHNVRLGRKKTPNFAQFLAVKILRGARVKHGKSEVGISKLEQLPIIMQMVATGRRISENENIYLKNN